jgi:dTMP kinase
VLEGIDRAGKETHCNLLAQRLKSLGLKVAQCRFPRYDKPFGFMIGEWLRKKREFSLECIQLLHTLDKQDAVADMKRLLDDGSWIVCDRYYPSQLAYGMSELSADKWDWLNEMGAHLIKPDLVVVVDITEEESWKRRGKEESDRNEKDLKKLKVVRDQYRHLYLRIKAQPDSQNIGHKSAIVGGAMDVGRVGELIWANMLCTFPDELGFYQVSS